MPLTHIYRLCGALSYSVLKWRKKIWIEPNLKISHVSRSRMVFIGNRMYDFRGRMGDDLGEASGDPNSGTGNLLLLRFMLESSIQFQFHQSQNFFSIFQLRIRQTNVTLLQHLRTILWSIIQIYNSTEDLDHKQVQITSPLTEVDVIRSVRFLGRRKVLLTLIQNVLICPALLKSLHSSEAFLTKTDNILIITSSNQIIKIYSIRHHAVTIKRSPNVKLNSRKFQWLFASMLKGIMQDLRWIEVHSLGWLYSDEGGKYLWKEATRLLGN